MDNLNGITDINVLKALAYDQIAAKEQAETNLRLINQRIQALAHQQAQERARVISEERVKASKPGKK